MVAAGRAESGSASWSCGTSSDDIMLVLEEISTADENDQKLSAEDDHNIQQFQCVKLSGGPLLVEIYA